MFTKIDLCSMALLKLGEKPIQSLREDSATAQLARTLFDSTVNTLLSVFPWYFATQLISVNKNTDGDCVVPSNVLRVIKCEGQIIGNKIITSAPRQDHNIRYARPDGSVDACRQDSLYVRRVRSAGGQTH